MNYAGITVAITLLALSLIEPASAQTRAMRPRSVVVYSGKMTIPTSARQIKQGKTKRAVTVENRKTLKQRQMAEQERQRRKILQNQLRGDVRPEGRRFTIQRW